MVELYHEPQPGPGEDEPLDMQTDLRTLSRSFITPTEFHFMRNHGPMPRIDPQRWRLEISGMVERPLRLGLSDLIDAFPKVERAITLACAGSRYQEGMDPATARGTVPWERTAIGTALWGGVSLADVLEAAGVEHGARFVHLVGHDELYEEDVRHHYGNSIALAQAMSGDVLLAYEMNGATLPLGHGFPLRAVVAGAVGSRSVKWLARLSVQMEPGHASLRSWTHQSWPPGMDSSAPGGAHPELVDELPVHSVICVPADGADVRPGSTWLRGYAISGQRAVTSVEVSTDGGVSWMPATIQAPGDRWTWVIWAAEVELEPGVHELIVRAQDEDGRTQPERSPPPWRARGDVDHAYHRIVVLAGRPER